MLPRSARWVALLVLALAAIPAAWAQSVALQGMLGDKALLIVDGHPPATVAAGQTHRGVKVVSTTREDAVVEYGGRRHTLRLGEAPASVGSNAPPPGRGSRIVLMASSGGHFLTQGAINGRATYFMVDTGATMVAMGASEAERLGVNWRNGQLVRVGTANGVVNAWFLKLSSIRIGEVELYEVDALVSQQPMPYVLLGNSFLSRFQMKRDNDQMVLERRF